MDRFVIRAGVTIAVAYALVACTTVQADSLRLSVDPFSGSVVIQNTSTTAVSIDSYQITSAAGALIPDPTHTSGVGWDSLLDGGDANWEDLSPTSHALSEVNFTSSRSIAGMSSINLGKAYSVGAAQDLQWGYSKPDGTIALPSTILFGGGLQVQVINLMSNHNASVESTSAILVNQEASMSFNFDAYVIGSSSGGLIPANFNAYTAHGVAGWESVTPSSHFLSELNLSNSSTLATGGVQVLGQIFATNATKDLTLQFHLVNQTPTYNGTVVYTNQLAGDANNDGVVNGLDIALVASHWLHSDLTGDVNFDGVVNGLDIAQVASHWLNTSAGPGAGTGTAFGVPEPSGCYLFTVGSAILSFCGVVTRRRVRHAAS